MAPGERALRATFLVSLTLLLLVAPLTSQANPHGIVGYAQTGAICHSEKASDDVKPILLGLPVKWAPGATYTLTVSVRGGPPADLTRGGHAGGFNLRASDGELAPASKDTVMRSERGETWHDMTAGSHSNTPFARDTWGEVTFTHLGANAREWEVLWQAPDEGGGDVHFDLAVLSANGDHAASTEDQWAIASFAVSEGAPRPFLARYATEILVGVALVAAGGLLLFARARRAANAPHGRQARRHRR